MLSFNVSFAIALAVALLAPVARATDPCCVGACKVAGQSKYYSVDTKHDMCGECCMDPKNYNLYHIFEPGLRAANGTNSPCALQMSPHAGELNYTNYTSTVTHGAGPIKMTLDLYKACPAPAPPPAPPQCYAAGTCLPDGSDKKDGKTLCCNKKDAKDDKKACGKKGVSCDGKKLSSLELLSSSSSKTTPVLHRRPLASAIGDPAPGTCPVDPKTKLPSVWYEPMSDVGNRKKRCDWDYDPPCGLCEGIGGYSWGDQENDITYISCKPVALAKDIPANNITTPVWPKSFVVKEVTTLINQLDEGGRFPGADPCALHNFNNDTETMYYDDTRTHYPTGPIMYTKTSGTAIYTLPTADMFIKIFEAGIGVFCICVTPHENGNKTDVPTGPLRYDFASDSVLIGREVIGLEGLGIEVEADHWNKGPHHFWISVATNEFVRGWQPWNGLNVYDPGSWQVGPVNKSLFDVPTSCYKGFLHKNVSCIAPYP